MGLRDNYRSPLPTLLRMYIQTYFSLQDVHRSDEAEGVPLRLTEAVLAVSRHTTDAHFVLVADGFELEAATKNLMVST